MSVARQAGKLTLADFAADQEGPDNSILDTLLDDLIGSESVKSKLESLRDTVLFAQVQPPLIWKLMAHIWFHVLLESTSVLR